MIHRRDYPSWPKILVPLWLGAMCLVLGWDTIGTMWTSRWVMTALILLTLSAYWSYRMIRQWLTTDRKE
ncbi:MAG: hypothetical protein HY290_26940 [Planctomycetia bacterium]|nr:hypothetical protein [Planctomycetia bacterium]